MADNAQRHAALANPVHAALRSTNTPSPSSDGAGPLPFHIPLQPTPKLGRSLSHSQGQRDFAQGSAAAQTDNGGAQAGIASLPLGLLQEENDTDTESDFGGRLTQTMSHPPIGSMMRGSTTFPLAFNSSSQDRTDKHDMDYSSGQHARRVEAAFANLNLGDPPQRRTQWQSSLGWDDVPNVNESRRHSLADIPTRRGSLAGGESGFASRMLARDNHEPDLNQFRGLSVANRPPEGDRGAESRATPRNDGYGIADMYNPSYGLMTDADRNVRREQQQIAGTGMQWGANGGRPRKQLYIVSFKCSRVDVFYLLDNTGLSVSEGDMVIVEADRGQDLGTVQHARVTPEVARDKKKQYSEEQYRWLMMYSQNKAGGVNPNAQVHGESNREHAMGEPGSASQGMLPRDNFANLKPKAIKRLANEHEIKMLAEKEGNEAKAKRTCQQKVAHLRLEMEILDAEWQWDFQKLIFYYYADKYINFKDLITELYRIYKTRIWLSAINPASFSQHALGQPPSGIGPGAVSSYSPYGLNNSYTMAYGEDGDPYGARMPYNIPFDTYTPNYPSIPGVANSFAPQGFPIHPYMFYPNAAAATNPMAGRMGNDERAYLEGAAAAARANAMPGYNTFFARASAADAQTQAGLGLANPAGPGTPSSHAAYGGQPLAWNAGPASPSALAGLSRQPSFPQPIGTRRLSHGQGDGQSSTSEEAKRGGHVDSTQSPRPLDPTRAGFTFASPHDSAANNSTSGVASGSKHSNNDDNDTFARRTNFADHLGKLSDSGARSRLDSRHNRAMNHDRYLTTVPTSADFQPNKRVHEF